MKVFMYHSDNGGCGYYRVKQPAKWLDKISCKVKRLPDEYCDKEIPIENKFVDYYDSKIGTYKDHAEWADLMVFQRVDKPELLTLIYAIKSVLKKKVAVDYDDDIFNVPVDNPSYKYFYNGSDKQYWCKKVMELADFITVSTKYLADSIKKNVPSARIEVIPNYADLEVMAGSKEVRNNKSDKVVIGWMGSTTHYLDFKECLSALKRIFRSNKNVIFKYAGMETDYFKDLKDEFGDERIISLGWIKNSEYYEKLKTFDIDIFIAPLQRHPFNDSKSNIKWIEASALKIPIVVSKVGAYDNIIDGVNGFTAIDEQDWYYILQDLIKSDKLREKIGLNAYNDVKANWNIETKIKDRLEIYKRYLQ